MVAYLQYVQILKETFMVVTLVHVPREQNAQAKLLAKLASSKKEGQIEDTYTGDPEDTSNHLKHQCGSPEDKHFRRCEEKSLVVGSGNPENAQNKHIRVTRGRVNASLPSRRRRNLDDALPMLLG